MFDQEKIKVVIISKRSNQQDLNVDTWSWRFQLTDLEVETKSASSDIQKLKVGTWRGG